MSGYVKGIIPKISLDKQLSRLILYIFVKRYLF